VYAGENSRGRMGLQTATDLVDGQLEGGGRLADRFVSGQSEQHEPQNVQGNSEHGAYDENHLPLDADRTGYQVMIYA